MKTATKFLTASAVIASLMLTGCSVSPTPAGNNETDKSAGIGTKGARACITNNSEKSAKIIFGTSSSSGALVNNILGPGQTTCGEGTSFFYKWDLQFDVRFRDNTNKSLYIGNQAMGSPLVADDLEFMTAADAKCGFSMKGPMGQAIGFSELCTDAFKVGTTRGYTSVTQVGEHLVNVTRLEDSNWKEFQVNIIR
jgi:hypothetical protein